MGPRSSTFIPAEARPASSADSNMYPDMRVSLPIRISPRPCLENTFPAAQPRRSINSAVIGSIPTRPRMPSVPKYFFVFILVIPATYSRDSVVIAVTIFSASTVSPTSWTRTTFAP